MMTPMLRNGSLSDCMNVSVLFCNGLSLRNVSENNLTDFCRYQNLLKQWYRYSQTLFLVLDYC